MKKGSSLQVMDSNQAAANKAAAALSAEPVPEELEKSGSVTLAVSGMWCASCASAVEATLRKQPGVISARVVFASETARVVWDPAQTVLSEIIRGASNLGYGISSIAKSDSYYQNIKHSINDLRRRLFVSLIFGLYAMLAVMALHAGLIPETSVLYVVQSAVFATLCVLCYGGWLFFKAGFRTLRAGVPGMDFLISMGAIGSLLLSLWNLYRGQGELYLDSASMLIVLLLCGRYIEHTARRKSRSLIRTLLSEAPDKAAVIKEGGKDERCPVERIHKGAHIRLRPGERISLDGKVIRGESHLDNSLITGETAPVLVVPGSKVLAGAINTEGELEVEVEAVKGQRRIDEISRRMENMLAEKTSYETLAAYFARKLIPVVLIIALATTAYLLLIGAGIEQSLVRAVAVLVISCPCALGLATPMALLVAIGKAAQEGIILRDGETLEQLSRLNGVLFDKTGTLTEGKAYLVSVHPAPGYCAEQVVHAAVCAERGSEHPIAKAIWQTAIGFCPPPGQTKAVPGKGVQWRSDQGDRIVVGSRTWLEEQGFKIGQDGAPEGTPVYVGANGLFLGTIVVDDKVRPDAKSTLDGLAKLGLALEMITGDEQAAALRVAQAVGIAKEFVHAKTSPEQKAEIITRKQEKGEFFAYVGEGLNDGPALTAACVGVAVQGACDLALASAPVVLQQGGISGVLKAINLAKKTRRIMKQNLFFGVLYNLLAVPLAVMGYVNPTIAAVAMVLSSLSVTLNSLRLRRG